MSAARADEMLELVGLTDKADTREDKLSGGQRQRLSIACALIHDPDVVFLDEPTAALDPQARRNLWDVLRAIQERGKTILYTTHYLDEAEILCDRVAIMDEGRILAHGRARHARARPRRANPRHPGARLTVHRRRAGAARRGRRHRGRAVADHRHPRARPTCSRHWPTARALAGLQVRTATLEDVFLDLTGREYRA